MSSLEKGSSKSKCLCIYRLRDLCSVLYHILTAPKRAVWGIDGAIGYGTLLLTANVYHQLAVSQRVNLGLRVNMLPIKVTDR